MDQPLISCIIGVYNGERYIGEAVDSILAQTYRSLEIVVADDGSTDSTSAIVNRYGPPVRYFWQPNAGPGAARNLGLGNAQGEFIAFLDADDLWHPEKLERQLSRFQARPDLEMCVTHVQNFWDPALQEIEAKFREHRPIKPLPGYVTQALLARRNLFEKLGYFDAAWRHIHDAEWFVRATEDGVVMELLPDVLVFRRLHGANRSHRQAITSRDEYCQLVKFALDRRRRKSDEEIR
jgi:glycosyltransferase involved in cell wall biosynthesis